MLQRLMILVIKIYRYTLSNPYGRNCRYYPTCSKYSLEAIETFGAWKGLWLCCRRLIRCHPWCHGGYDPIPSKF